MKKLMALLASLTLVLAACGNDTETQTQTEQANEPQTLKVASLIPPMTDMLEIAKEQLAEDNIELEIVVLGDNVQPNSALAAKEVDANFFQHVPYMEEFNRSNDANLVPIEPIYFANYGVYAKNYDNMEDIPEGATIAIANDVS
ncbi:MAG: ABC transporter substrate-binding protein, partial [Exiguobacterium sp.]|nr:ABC transporter substrate-binding protein [Exiguobacterium sp.]